MAGFDLVAIQDAITTKLRATLPNTPLDEDGQLDDEHIHRDANGQAVPYIVPRYGSLRRRPEGYSFAGTRYDDYYSTVDISCVAPTGRSARQMLAICSDAMIGFKPDDHVEMTVEGLPDTFTITSNFGRPTAFVASIRFRHGANAEDPGAHLSPPMP